MRTVEEIREEIGEFLDHLAEVQQPSSKLIVLEGWLPWFRMIANGD